MRHLISGLVAAVAVMASAPAMACGYTGCAPVVYEAPIVAYTSSGCNPCGGVSYGYGYEREQLADPIEQYYYVNQGPTYSGPGAWAPARVYQEDTVSGYGVYHRPHYGYRRMGYHHGYAPRHAYAPGYHYGHRVLRRYY